MNVTVAAYKQEQNKNSTCPLPFVLSVRNPTHAHQGVHHHSSIIQTKTKTKQ
jgi:hypothetical protein